MDVIQVMGMVVVVTDIPIRVMVAMAATIIPIPLTVLAASITAVPRLGSGFIVAAAEATVAEVIMVETVAVTGAEVTGVDMAAITAGTMAVVTAITKGGASRFDTC